ncbi:hypothetical protein L6164_001162 [Bauhinia variegata]|uniref:Uncharacterized protein n=1 Tax=Bauhinia variegata TaxID=167791 RepID=A0ACB9QAW3_BAUVA|nr:hypothetical protein L6164_001162 [Bauhinia variegata]
MAEVGISVVTKVAEYLVQPVIRQGQYLFCANKFFKYLEDKKKELMSTQDIVPKRVEDAKRKTERIEDIVQKWLTEVQTLLEEVEKLEQQVKANNSCFQGRCPTWRRYHLCKEMVEKTKALNTSSEGFTFFESTKLAYGQLWEALQDDGIYRIALFGLGGSGKTTLVREVGKKAKESNLFDRVVAFTVSQTPNVRNIQGQMADMLNFKLEVETEEGRAQRLHMRLKEEKRILKIVDDVWGEFNLEDTGNDFDICHSGSCKIILTTRRQQVCTLMNCQKKIWLDLLNEDEAWALFKKHADPDNQSSLSLLSSAARDIARECKGLPIAIQAVGKSLKGQSIHEWKIALEKLRSSKPVDVEDGQGDVFSCLKLSYDYLKDENKLLFLICCIFPEDYDISKEDLIRCGVGLGVYGQYQSFDLARSQVMVGINKLVDSCLLMHSKRRLRKKRLKMHDLVRDLGLRIASKESRTIMVNLSNDLNSMIEDGVRNDKFAVSSWYGQTNQISTIFVAVKLEILWIETGSSLDLSSASFEGLQGLKVMVLNSNHIYQLSLPPSIESLTNLRTLCLRGWNLGNISFVVKLKKLEVFELKSCLFNELPNEITNLNKLKLLDLSDCDAVSESYEAIGELSEIEELHVSGGPLSSGRWRNLIPSFVDNVAATKLQRYVIKFHWMQPFLSRVITDDLIHRALYLKSVNISILSESIKNLLQKAEHLDFEIFHGDCQNLVPDVVRAVGGMKDLVVLGIAFCLEIECVVDTTSNEVDVELPALVGLHLRNMTNLKEVYRGSPPVGFLEKLEELLYLAAKSYTAYFQGNLEELIVRCCGELKHIITEQEDGSLPRRQPAKALDLKIRRTAFGLFTSVKVYLDNYYSEAKFESPLSSRIKCDKLKCLFPIIVSKSLQELTSLKVDKCEELEEIMDENIEHKNLSDAEVCFPKLKLIQISLCRKLKSLLPVAWARKLPQLSVLDISHADKLKVVFSKSSEEGTCNGQEIVIPNLVELKFIKLQFLLAFAQGLIYML